MRLEYPQKKHEQEYIKMIQEFVDNKEIVIPRPMGIKEGENYDDLLERTKKNTEGKNPKHGYMKSTLYFIIDNEEQIIWAVHIRHELNDELKFRWGNIGYGIKPSERKKWYATIWLKLALEKCKELWLDKVILTCKKENIWSSKTILKNWWIWDSEYEFEEKIEERYWIPIK